MRRLIALGSLVAVCGLAFGLVWFQPWKLWTNHRVNDTLPAVALVDAPLSVPASSTPSASVSVPYSTAPSLPASLAPSVPRSTAPPSPVVLARGTFISHEHHTTGRVSVVRQPNGTRVLAIARLSTSEGPDVKVWLTDAPVIAGNSGWHVFDDGTHVSLGSLKGNLGNQVYAIPASADLTKLTSVDLWCDRFDVSFGAATLGQP